MSRSCRVCSDPKGGKHYGSYCCEGCKGFFRRTLTLNQTYRCIYTNQCQITIKSRNCCQACRFDKCLAEGLNPNMVQDSRNVNKKEKQKDMIQSKIVKWENKKFEFSEITNVKLDEYKAFVNGSKFIAESRKMYQASKNPLGAMKIIKKFEKYDELSVIQYFVDVERICNDYVDNVANHVFFPQNEFYTNLSALQVLSEPRKICPRTKLEWTDKFLVTSDVLQQGWCRSFLNYIDWASHIPELQQLTVDDQVRLVMDRGTSCMNILAGYRAFQNNVKGMPFSGGAYFPRDDYENKSIDPGFSPMLKEYAISIYDDITLPAKELNLSPAEYALLRVITFLTPVPGLSPNGTQIVKNANKFYREILINETRNERTEKENLFSRTGKILNFLYVTDVCSAYCDKGYSVMALFNIANMKGDLLYEYYIRKGFRE